MRFEFSDEGISSGAVPLLSELKFHTRESELSFQMRWSLVLLLFPVWLSFLVCTAKWLQESCLLAWLFLLIYQCLLLHELKEVGL